MTAIMGKPSCPKEKVLSNLATARAKQPHARFPSEMFEPLWRMGCFYGLDSVVMIAQSMHETDSGHFSGKVPHTYFNTSGIKVRDLTPFPDSEVPLAHSQYASWYGGAEAQAQHLLAYCGKLIPDTRYLVDPRAIWVRGKHAITQVEELGTRWAPSAEYGNMIVSLMQRLSV